MSGNPKDIKDEVLQRMDKAMAEIQEYKKMTIENTTDWEEEMRTFKTEMKAEILNLKTAMLELITTINTTNTTKQNKTSCTSNIEDRVQETKGKVLGVRHKINKMKSMLQAMETKTYAQAAVTHPGISASSLATIANLENKERQRNDRRRIEMTLTTRNATEEIKKEVASMPPPEIAKRCQNAINQTIETTHPDDTTVKKPTVQGAELAVNLPRPGFRGYV
jgi:hypothetical protein